MTRTVNHSTPDSIPWREAYPECSEDQLIGKALAGARYREGLTQIALSELICIPQRHISEMENGKRIIVKEMAKRLGKALNIGYKVFRGDRVNLSFRWGATTCLLGSSDLSNLV